MEDRLPRPLGSILGDFKWNPRGKIEHPDVRSADAHGSAGPTNVRLKHGGDPRTHRIYDGGTLKEIDPHTTSHPSSIPPCGTICVTSTTPIFTRTFADSPGTKHLHGLILQHWMFSALLDSGTGALPVRPLVMRISINGSTRAPDHWLQQGLDTDDILLPFDFNTAETYARAPSGTPERVIFYRRAADFKLEDITISITTLAGVAVTFHDCCITFKTVPTQWEK